MKEAQGTRDYDWWLLAILGAICTIGVLEIYSATHGSALAGMHMKQVRWIAVGIVLMFVMSRLDYHAIMDQAPWLYIAGLAALTAVLAVGHTRFGAKRWIPVLGEFLQVSELVKLIIIIVLARFFADVRTGELALQDLIQAGLLVGLPLGFSSRAAMEACRGNRGNRDFDATRRVAYHEAVPERKSDVVFAS